MFVLQAWWCQATSLLETSVRISFSIRKHYIWKFNVSETCVARPLESKELYARKSEWLRLFKKGNACWDQHHLGSWPMPKLPFSIIWACLENSDSFPVQNNSPLHKKNTTVCLLFLRFVWPLICFCYTELSGSAYVVCPATQIQDYYAAATDSVEDFQNRLPGERNVGGSYTI